MFAAEEPWEMLALENPPWAMKSSPGEGTARWLTSGSVVPWSEGKDEKLCKYGFQPCAILCRSSSQCLRTMAGIAGLYSWKTVRPVWVHGTQETKTSTPTSHLISKINKLQTRCVLRSVLGRLCQRSPTRRKINTTRRYIRIRFCTRVPP